MLDFLLEPSTSELDFLSFSCKLIIFALCFLVVWTLWTLTFLSFETDSSQEQNQDGETAINLPDLQTYQNKEIEDLKKKYDAPSEPEINIESSPSGIKVFWCHNGIKTELKSTQGL